MPSQRVSEANVFLGELDHVQERDRALALRLLMTLPGGRLSGTGLR